MISVIGATACTNNLPVTELLDDDETVYVGEERLIDVLANDYSQSDIEIDEVFGDGDGYATATLSDNAILVVGETVGPAEFSYTATIDGEPQAETFLRVRVIERITTPTPTPTPTLPGPTPTATPSPDPGPTPTLTPTPTPTATPTAEAQQIMFECRTTAGATIPVGQRFDMFAIYSPDVVGIQIDFHHGDGTTESGSDRQNGFYAAPGTYVVTADWSWRQQSGTATCGTIIAKETLTAPDFTCSVSRSGPLGVQEAFTMNAHSARTDLIVTFNHGDGTILTVGYTQEAWYLAPGSYSVTASWRSPEGMTGSATCGTVVVQSDCSATTVRRPNGFCEPLIRFECELSPPGPFTVNDPWEATVTFSPSDAPLQVTIDDGNGQITNGLVANGTFDLARTYTIIARWRAGSSQGHVECGTVEVAGAEPDYG